MKFHALWLSFLLCVPIVGIADVLAGWDVAGVKLNDGSHTAPYVLVANTSAVHVVTAVISLSSNVNPTTSVDQYGFKISGVNETNSLAGAIEAGHYIEITVAAAKNHVLSLTSLEMNGESTSTGCDEVAVFSSIDGFAGGAEIASVADVADGAGGFDTDDTGFGGPIDLSDTKYGSLKSITIRIYGWNSTDGAGITRLRNLSGFDLTVNGTVEYDPPEGGVMTIR